MAIAIDIRNLHFRYKNQTQWALKDINLELEKGKVLGVLGPGGSGKSTLCHLFNGIVPHAVDGEYLGEVRIFDQDIRQLRVQSLSKSVGRVLQDAEMQIVGRIVNEDVAFGMQNYLVNSEEIRQRVPEVLNQLGLSHLSNRPSDQLSGGEKQRLAIAGIWATEPGILILDNPFSEQDVTAKSNLIRHLQGMKLRGNPTIILVARDIQELVPLADELVYMEHGQISWRGEPKDFSSPPDPLQELYRSSEQRKKDSDSNSKNSCSCDPVFEIRNLNFSYNPSLRVLKNINLKVNAGDCVGIIGPNGSGKTSLVKLLIGLNPVCPNSVLFKGQKLETISQKDLMTSVGFVFQNPDHQLCENSVEDELTFGLKARSYKKPIITRRLAAMLELTGLADQLHDHPFSLSRGFRQVLAIASIAIMKPEVMVVDEPNSDLDPPATKIVMDILDFCRKKGSTIIMVSHDISLIQNYCNRVVGLLEGEMVVDCTISQWLKTPSLRAGSGLFNDW